MPRATNPGMASWWRNLFGVKERAAPEGMTVTNGIVVVGSGAGAPRRGTRELMIAYREQPWLRAVAGRIARGVASVKWEVYVRAEEPTSQKSGRRERRSPEGRFLDVAGVPSFRWGRDYSVKDLRLTTGSAGERAARRRELADAGLLREVPDHPLLTLLANPNPELTGRSALQMSQTWIDLKGEAFWLLAKKDGVPTQYLPMPPHWITATPTRERPTFRVSYQALQLEVAAADMVWLRDPDPENPYGRGTGVAEALGDELETDEYAAKYVKDWFFNGGLPSAIVSFEGLGKDDVKRAEEKWSAAYSGSGKAHRVHFAGGKMNAQKLDTSFKEQQIGELRKGQRDTVVQVFGVPPEMVGIIENSNRSTIDGAHYIYALGVEFPRGEFLRSELQQKLAPQFDEGLCLECEVHIPASEERRLNVMKAQPTVFSKNEWRDEAGYAPLQEFEGQFPAGMPGQANPGEPEEEPKNEPADPEQEPTEPEEKSAPIALPADPPWAKTL